MRTRRFGIEIILLLAVCTFGCAKKAKNPVVPVPTETSLSEPAPADSPVPAAASAPDDPLGGSLDSVNAYVHEKGLLGDVFFEFDRSEIRPEDVSRLRRNATFIREHPEFGITIEGHCDERDTVEYNLALGARRASAAQSYVLDLGVEPGRTDTVSYGKERPLCNESSNDCWSRNRRAHFVITSRRGEERAGAGN